MQLYHIYLSLINHFPILKHSTNLYISIIHIIIIQSTSVTDNFIYSVPVQYHLYLTLKFNYIIKCTQFSIEQFHDLYALTYLESVFVSPVIFQIVNPKYQSASPYSIIIKHLILYYLLSASK